jgi:hypothetical protein
VRGAAHYVVSDVTSTRRVLRLGQLEPFSVHERDEVEVPRRVRGDHLADVGAERQHREVAAAGVVKCLGDQLSGQSAAVESGVDLGVGERDLAGAQLVLREPSELLVVVDLVAMLFVVVADGGHEVAFRGVAP